MAELRARVASLERRLDGAAAERARLLALLEEAQRRRTWRWPGIRGLALRVWRGGG